MKIALLAVFFATLCACGSPQSDSTTQASGPDPVTEPAVSDPPPSDDPQPAAVGRVVVSTDPCTTDSDCVPAGCCHPAACVATGNQPACGESVCTTDCRYDTLDCGGSCFCQSGHCAARLSVPPVIPGVSPPQ